MNLSNIGIGIKMEKERDVVGKLHRLKSTRARS